MENVQIYFKAERAESLVFLANGNEKLYHLSRIEIILAAGGLILILTQASGSMSKGIGTGLLIQTLFMLAADYFAAKRGHIYLDWLQELVKRIN